MMLTYCNHLMELFVSVVSCVLSRLKIYLAEKHIKQDLQEAKSPLYETVAAGPI
jgi:hypothetical protein